MSRCFWLRAQPPSAPVADHAQSLHAVLYSFRRCPYAIRARMALTAAGVVFDLREVSLRDKPAVMLAASPKGTVPVLVLADGTVIDESLDIMAWAVRHRSLVAPVYGDLDLSEPSPPMRMLIAANDGPFKHHLDRMKYATRYPGTDPVSHREAAIDLLRPLDDRLQTSQHLFGPAPSFVDLALFPFVRQFAHADRDAFAASSMSALRRWLTGWELSVLFKAVMIQHPVWQHGDLRLQT